MLAPWNGSHRKNGSGCRVLEAFRRWYTHFILVKKTVATGLNRWQFHKKTHTLQFQSLTQMDLCLIFKAHWRKTLFQKRTITSKQTTGLYKQTKNAVDNRIYILLKRTTIA